MAEKLIKPKKIKGKITTLLTIRYEGIMIYVRRINEDIFEWLLPYRGEIYSNYMVITPDKGKKKLNKGQTNTACQMITAGAGATIDMLLKKKKKKKVAKKPKKVVN